MKAEETKRGYKVIKCPHCGAEFLASEIFMPGEIVGKARSVVRDALNRLIYVEWEDDEEEEHDETYCCDFCGEEFTISPVVTYKVAKQEEELDFNHPEASLLD